MHPYATNSTERRNVILGISILSILLAYGLNRLVVLGYLSIPWWLDAPSVLGFFGLLYKWFDRQLWKTRPFTKIGLVKVPDLNGSWEGQLGSSHQEFDAPHHASAKIQQSWTDICIALRTKHSCSESIMAAVLINQPDATVLTYQYRNEPHAQAVNTMHMHKGTVWLSLRRKRSSEVLEGDYYSGRGRQNFGHLRLERKPVLNSAP